MRRSLGNLGRICPYSQLASFSWPACWGPFPAAPDTLDLDIRIDVRDVSLQPVGDGWQGRLDVWVAQLGPGDDAPGAIREAELRQPPWRRRHAGKRWRRWRRWWAGSGRK